MDETLRRLQKALQRVEKADAKLQDARTAFYAAFDACLAAGASKSEIARVMGVSRQRVQQIARERR